MQDLKLPAMPSILQTCLHYSTNKPVTLWTSETGAVQIRSWAEIRACIQSAAAVATQHDLPGALLLVSGSHPWRRPLRWTGCASLSLTSHACHILNSLVKLLLHGCDCFFLLHARSLLLLPSSNIYCAFSFSYACNA